MEWEDLEENSYLDGLDEGYEDGILDSMDFEGLDPGDISTENLLEGSDDVEGGSLLDSVDGSDVVEASGASSDFFSQDIDSLSSSGSGVSEGKTMEDIVSDTGSFDVDEGYKDFENLGESFDFDPEESYLLDEPEDYYSESEEFLESGGYDSGPEDMWSLDTGFDSVGGVSSSGRDVYTVSALRSFYDDAASGEDVSVGSFDSPSSLFGRFVDEIGEDRAQLVSEVLGAWVNWPTNKSTAPLWHIFAEANDNFKVPIEFDDDGIDAEAFGEALHSFSDFTQEEFRERFGDSVVLYRSVDETGFVDMKQDAPETGSVVLDHRPVESWTLDPEFAESWKNGYVLRKEVEVDDILASQVTHPSFIGREKEVLVESDGREKYSEDEIVHSSEFDMQENADWALSQIGEPETDIQRVSGPEWMAVENAVDEIGLGEYGAITANKSSEFMHVARYEDGREAFVTELSSTEYQGSDGADPVEAERALAGEQFFENLGLDHYIPDHFVDFEEGYMAVEAIDGYEIDKAPEEVREQVDTDDYLKFAAATVLSGNSDMDGRNTMIDEDGNIYGIDIDHAGGDFTDGGRHYRRGMKDIKMNADKLGLDINYEDIKEATELVAQQVDPFEATEGIEPSQVSNREMYNFRQNIVNNITSFAQGNFPGEFGYAESAQESYSIEGVRAS